MLSEDDLHFINTYIHEHHVYKKKKIDADTKTTLDFSDAKWDSAAGSRQSSCSILITFSAQFYIFPLFLQFHQNPKLIA